MREIAGYRQELEILNLVYPERNRFTAKELASFCGMSRNTFKKYYPEFCKGGTKVDFAKARARRSAV